MVSVSKRVTSSAALFATRQYIFSSPFTGLSKMAAPTPRFTLYMSGTSYFAQKVMMAFFEKNEPFVEKLVNQRADDNYESWYMKLNPLGKVPILEDRGKIIPESDDIIDYLDKELPKAPRLVPDPSTDLGREVAHFRKLLNFSVGIILYGLAYNPHLSPDYTAAKTREELDEMIAGQIAKLEKLATENPDLRDAYLAKIPPLQQRKEMCMLGSLSCDPFRTPRVAIRVEEDDNVTFAVLLYAYIIAREKEDEQQLQLQPQRARGAAVRHFLVRPCIWLSEEMRQPFGEFYSLLDTHLRLEDPVAFQNYTRLTPERFDEVLQRVTPMPFFILKGRSLRNQKLPYGAIQQKKDVRKERIFNYGLLRAEAQNCDPGIDSDVEAAFSYLMSGTPGETWLLSSDLTAADISLAVLLRRVSLSGLASLYFSPTQRPALHKYWLRLQTLPAYCKLGDIAVKYGVKA
ncbi:uncharacterized protein LOC124285532 [Haliotis rubra]|uniref:uncharacterized protein LOC124285532 n=1 Tax=Haliotis rubra TaxID=36100 RepID=UPI001EE5F755|nr:uncharacterized protein LOC124285532 [Haliotis rubra]